MLPFLSDPKKASVTIIASAPKKEEKKEKAESKATEN